MLKRLKRSNEEKIKHLNSNFVILAVFVILAFLFMVSFKVTSRFFFLFLQSTNSKKIYIPS